MHEHLAITDNEKYKKAGVKKLSNAGTDPEPVEPSSLSRQATEAVERMIQVANQQMQKLTEAMSCLQTPPALASPMLVPCRQRAPPLSQRIRLTRQLLLARPVPAADR